MILTSAGQIDSTTQTGLWFEEFAVPYEIFQDAGFEVTVASIQGGEVPIDPRSLTDYEQTPANERASAALKNSLPLTEVDAQNFDALFFPGGHGTMFDLPDNERVAAAIRGMLKQGKIVSAVCHGPAAFVNATKESGEYVVKGRRMTGFTNEEEIAVGLDKHMPFLLETRLTEQGAQFIGGAKFQEHVIVDGNFITGQNPASSKATAEAIVRALKQKFAQPESPN
jgi:putative intracellular protease/amidase